MADGSVVIDIVGDATRYNQTLQEVAAKTRAHSAAISSGFKAAGSAISAAGSALLPLTGGIIAAGVAAVKTGVQMGSFLQQTEIGFATMLGSADEAKSMMQDLKTFSAKTPFDIEGVMSASKKLMAYGFSAKKVIPMLTAVGDASAGLGLGTEGMNRLTVAIGQMQAKGKVSAEEMRQLAEAGVPAWDMLAKKIGVSIPEAMKMAEKGAIDADTGIGAIIEGMNKRFGGLMDKQSKTAAGAASNLKDAFVSNLGDAFIQPLDKLAPKIAELADALGPAMQKVGPVVGQLVGKLEPFFNQATALLDKVANSSTGEIMNMISGLVKVAALGPALMATGKAVSGMGSAIGIMGRASAALQSGTGKALAGFAQGGQSISKFSKNARAGFQLISEDLKSMSGNGQSTFANLRNNMTTYTGLLKGSVIPSMTTVKDVGLKSMLGLGKGVGGLVGVAGLAGGALLGLGVMAQMSGADIGKMGADLANSISGFADKIPSIVSSITAVLPTVVNAIASAAPLVMNAVLDVVSNIVAAIPQLMPALLQTTMTLIQTLMGALPTMLPLLIGGVVQLVTGLASGITQALPILVAALPAIISGLVTAIVTNLPILLTAVISLIEQLATSLVAALPTLIEGVVSLIDGIIAMLPSILPSLLSAVIQIIIAVAKLIPTLIPTILGSAIRLFMSIVDAVPKVLSALLAAIKGMLGAAARNAISSAISAFGVVGAAISNGIKNGLTNAWNGLLQKLRALTNLLPATVKKLLGIHSPSKVFARLGIFVVHGMAKGLSNGRKMLTQATKEMAAAITSSKDVTGAADKLKGLLAKGLDHLPKSMSSTKGRLKKSLGNIVDTYTKQLKKIATKNEALSKSLSVAQEKLKEMQDYSSNYASKFSDYAQLSGIETTDKDGYLEILNNRAAASQSFAAMIDQLRKKGLSEDALSDIVGKGVVEGTSIANALIKGSSAEIAQINAYQKQIERIGNTVGDKFTYQMYGIGISAQQGIINGLLSKQDELKKAANAIASTLTRTIKKKLKIHSPSKVMQNLFDYAGQGAVNGLTPYVARIRGISGAMAQSAVAGVTNNSTSSITNYNTVKQYISAPVASFSEARAGARAGQRASLGF